MLDRGMILLISWKVSYLFYHFVFKERDLKLSEFDYHHKISRVP